MEEITPSAVSPMPQGLDKLLTDKQAENNFAIFESKQPWVGRAGVIIDAAEKDPHPPLQDVVPGQADRQVEFAAELCRDLGRRRSLEARAKEPTDPVHRH